MTSKNKDFAREAAEYDSDFEDDNQDNLKSSSSSSAGKKRKICNNLDLVSSKPSTSKSSLAHIGPIENTSRNHYLSLNVYERHKYLINHYQLCYEGSTSKLVRDTSKDKSDIDVIKAHHRFLWDEEENESWEDSLARKYWQRLFKEYCICDLSCYKENKIALRWRTEGEVTKGTGQFICGAKKCSISSELRTWEVNFAYQERGERKNALVKIRLCPDCSFKLNYHHKKKELTKRKSSHKRKKSKRKRNRSSSSEEEENDVHKKKKDTKQDDIDDKKASDVWKAPLNVETEKSRTEDFSEYLDDLFL